MDKMNMANDEASINALVSMLNDPNITGAQVPSAAEQAEAMPIAIASPRPVAVIPNAPIPATPAAPENTQRIFFTGRVKSGKDYLAEAAKCKIFGFADPMYALATYFFGVTVNSTQGKDLPGMRSFLQTLGQWGRGINDANYPYTPARAAFIQLIRSLGSMEQPGFCPSVDWKNYGLSSDLWVDSCVKRVSEYLAQSPEARVGLTNCRFINEYKALSSSGFQGWHVMASGPTMQKRWLAAGLSPEALSNSSEQMAARMDANTIKEISARRNGSKLHVIWSDSTPPPSNRFYTVDEFLGVMKSPAIPSHISPDDF